MISLINFEKTLVIPIEEAKILGLKYESSKIGIREGRLESMGQLDHYEEDCIVKDDKYYINQEAVDKDDNIASYWLYKKYTGPIEYVCIKAGDYLVDLLSFAPKCKHKFSIKESVISKEPTIDNINSILLNIEEKALSLNKLVNKIKDNTFNKKVNVHVGGGLIVTYNELLLKEDACTDVLQLELNNGWRIIAVCIQPDQRRPDYILGRYNPNLEVTDKQEAGR